MAPPLRLELFRSMAFLRDSILGVRVGSGKTFEILRKYVTAARDTEHQVREEPSSSFRPGRMTEKR